MTVEEQFDNTARLAAANSPTRRGLPNHNRLTDARTRRAKAHNRPTDELTEAHNRLTEEIAGYVAGCRERMKQMEANLHALIHILTAEQ